MHSSDTLIFDEHSGPVNLGAELRALLALAIPVALSEIGWMTMSVVDVVMVGKLGPAAIGAVGLGNAIYYAPVTLRHWACCWAWTRWCRVRGERAISTSAIAGWHRRCISRWPLRRY